MLTGAEKAVLFLLSLEEVVARAIVAEMTESELQNLHAVASTMREVPSGALESAYREFLDRSERAVAVPQGGPGYLRKLTTSALGEDRAREVFRESAASPFARLESAPPDAVAALLSNEPPQLAAAIMARLEPGAAAAILAAMTLERQGTVVGHISRMTEIPAKVLEDVATALAGELPTSDAATLVSVDGVARAAAILNAIGANSAAVLQALQQNDEASATQVRQAMFTFEDLRRLDSKAMRELLREVSPERVTIALKGASPEVTAAIFGGLSARAAELIQDDLSLLGRVKKSDLDAARREIIDAALRLESEGRIDLGREGD